MALPPGPRLPKAVQTAVFLRNPVGFLRRCQDRHGDLFTTRFLGLGDVVYVADPGEAKRIFKGSPDRFHAGAANARWLEPVVGRFSLLTLDEGEHLSQRKLLNPPFHGERIERFEQVFTAAAEREIARWPLGTPFALLPAMRRITLEVILRAVLGVRDEARLDALRDAILRLDAASGLVLPLPPLRRDLGRFSPWRRFLAARAAVDELVHEEIASHRSDPGLAEREDVLSMLIGARHEDGSPMSDGELRDEILTLLAAGYETASTSLAWAFERLLRTPPALARLITDPGDDAYLEAIVKETLRLRSPVTDSTRMVSDDTDVGGFTIPARTLLIVAIPLLHLRPQTYPEPHAFRPERFLEGATEPHTFIPFGGGVRRCIGAAFAQLEMKAVMRTIAERARLDPASPKPEKQRLHHVIVVPHRGARVVRRERRPAPAREVAAAPAAA